MYHETAKKRRLTTERMMSPNESRARKPLRTLGGGEIQKLATHRQWTSETQMRALFLNPFRGRANTKPPPKKVNPKIKNIMSLAL
jgi:hypothetical protein